MSSVTWNDDDALFRLIRDELFTAVVGDVMDQLGLQQQFLPPQIKPLRPDMVVVGRAMPVLESDTAFIDSNNSATTTSRNPALQQAFGLMLEALDDLKPHEVYLCTGASPSYALWGELMSLRATLLKAAGAIVNGYSRDTQGILDLGFPTFSWGAYAQDQAPRGRVIDYRCAVRIGTVHVNPGDIVFGDLDGVCVIPQQHETEVFRLAVEKARGEKTVRKAIEGGMSATEAYRQFGIL